MTRVIIDKIISDTSIEVELLKNKAKAEVESIIEEAKNQAKLISDGIIAKANAEAEELVRRKTTLAGLECKKLKLSQKQTELDTVYAAARQKIIDLHPKEYSQMIIGALSKFASGKEAVASSNAHNNIINDAFIAEVNRKLNFCLTLAPTADISGGVLLIESGQVKNLSLEVELAAARQTTEGEVARMLFGENNE